jgi:ATP adenylyltransferase
MDNIWAPWRLKYILTDGKAESCFICNAIGGDDDKANLLVWRGERCVCMLNKYPYNNGHLLVAPAAHKAELAELDDAELLESQHAIRLMLDVLGRTLGPQGYNVGLNLGLVAGAGLPGHLHWHIVPRWDGDTNFMPVLADVKVIVQSLDDLFDRLQEALSDERAVGS